MITKKDKIEQFKRDCKSVSFYQKKINWCNEKIEELDHMIEGVSCPNGNDQPKCENARNPYKDRRIELILEQDKYIDEREKYIDYILAVRVNLMKITDEKDRELIEGVFFENTHYSHYLKKYSYNDRSALRKHINSIIGKIV